jgi:hypothetical protein
MDAWHEVIKAHDRVWNDKTIPWSVRYAVCLKLLRVSLYIHVATFPTE